MKRNLLFVSLILVFVSYAAQAQGNDDDCELPEITETTGGGSYCLDEEVTLTINGDLGDADGWAWYANGDCDGDPINDESTTSISVNVTETTIY